MGQAEQVYEELTDSVRQWQAIKSLNMKTAFNSVLLFIVACALLVLIFLRISGHQDLQKLLKLSSEIRQHQVNLDKERKLHGRSSNPNIYQQRKEGHGIDPSSSDGKSLERSTQAIRSK